MSVIHAATIRRWRVWLEAVRMLFGDWRRLGCGAMVLHLMLLWPLGGYGAGDKTDNATCINDPSQCFREMLPIQEMRATVYTRTFAESFGLESPVGLVQKVAIF